MIPVLSAEQTRQADAYTIQHEPIASIDLMERASRAFVKEFTRLSERGHLINIFCGTGNNGGDGLAIASFLSEQGYKVIVCTVGEVTKGSQDFRINYERLKEIVSVNQIESQQQIPQIDKNCIVIDALFGSGLNKPVEGIHAQVISRINESGAAVFSVDIASGLFADKPTSHEAVIRPAHTISFQCPKAAFLHPNNAKFVGRWHIIKIGLDEKFIRSLITTDFYSEPQDFIELIPRRDTFDHKGIAGRVKIIAGSRGKMGAAILCSRAALRMGAGLVFVQVPAIGRDVLQTAVPEAMVQEDSGKEYISTYIPGEYDSVAIGPGVGTKIETVKALEKILIECRSPIVIDADGLNNLAYHPDVLAKVPKHSILTPHPGEFARMAGSWKDDFEKITLLKSFAKRHELNVVLKGAFSIVCSAKGECFYNCSGNPGMATGGSGDVLTGVIAALLAQKTDPFEALRTGVFLHGLAGDLAAEEKGTNGLIASDIVDFLPYAMQSLFR